MSEIQLQYFEEAILFFKEFQWLYNIPVTKILVESSLDLIPADWLTVFENMTNDELNNFVVNMKVQENWPKSLISFVENCQKLNKLPNPNISLCSIQLPEVFTKKLSLKKQYEIFHLAQLVHQQSLLYNISLIVDLGCGLGYICQLLNHLYGYRVLGIESKLQNVETAITRQKTLFPDSLSSVKYVCSTISKDSSKYIKAILQQKFEGVENICLIGLHACGDLSTYMSKIYLEMERAKLLILVSCCYHKLSLRSTEKKCENSDEEFFNYFPLSQTLNTAIDMVNINVGKIFRRPFMRLACQETSDRWLQMSEKTHDDHSFYVLARAVLELYGVQNDLQLKKLVRKGTRKSQCTNFENYLNDSMLRYVYEKNFCESTCSLPWNDRIQNDLIELWKNNAKKQKKIEIYTALQLLLQHTAESLVLLDRLHFLRENNFEASIVPMMNRSLSPRCNAIVSKKIQND